MTASGRFLPVTTGRKRLIAACRVRLESLSARITEIQDSFHLLLRYLQFTHRHCPRPKG
jgi:hypothetical protein